MADSPWIFRTYAGHSSAKASNELYRRNLAAGQTGLSIAFDLPTQCGYDSDHPLARPEVGKVGVPIASLDDMHALFDGIPIEKMNTSMTINGTAMWLLSLYVAMARERGVPEAGLRGTTQNDIVKEYLARGTYIFPPEPSLDLIAETYEYCVAHLPQWNPSNICSYHLQEAGASPVQELAFALADAIELALLLVAGHHEHGHAREAGLGAQLGAQLGAVAIGQLEVHQDHVGRAGLGQGLERLAGRVGRLAGEPALAQEPADQRVDFAIVFDDQDALHRWTFLISRRRDAWAAWGESDPTDRDTSHYKARRPS